MGHSNHAADKLVALLREHDVKLVVDVRSTPFSRWVPQANREALSATLREAGIDYLCLGNELGGKPQGMVADYAQLRESRHFQQGIAALIERAEQVRTVIMCSEGDHRKCHRYLLITPVLEEMGASVLHIQPDGSIVDESREPKQLTLF